MNAVSVLAIFVVKSLVVIRHFAQFSLIPDQDKNPKQSFDEFRGRQGRAVFFDLTYMFSLASATNERSRN